jgi:uncharacterized membrane protein
MSDVSPNTAPTPPQPQAPANSGLRSLAMICYVLYLVAWLNGFTALIGVIIAYVKRSDAAGTVWQSHFQNLITVFWITLIVFVLGLATWPIAFGAIFAQDGFVWPPPAMAWLPLLFGLLVFPVFAIWFLYRMIRGLLRASDDSAY